MLRMSLEATAANGGQAFKESSFRTAVVIAILTGLLALVFRWYFVTHAQVLQTVDQENIRGDAVQYYRYAWNMVHRGVFSSASPAAPTAVPNSFRDPGYPTLMAGVMALTNTFQSFYATVLLLQGLLGSATVAILIVAFRTWLSTAWLATAGCLMAIWPHSVTITAYLLSETLLAFLCACGLLALSWAIRRPSYGTFLATGFAFGLAAMTNAVLVPFGVVLGLALWWHRYVTGRLALTLALASLILPMAWGARSLTLPPAASATSRAITNLVQGSWPTYHVAYQLAAQGDKDSIEQLAGMQYEMDLLQKDSHAGVALMLHRMSQLPLPYLFWYLSKPKLLWDWDIRIGQGDIYVYATRSSPFAKGGAWSPLEGICFVINPIIMIMGLVGTIAAIFSTRRNAVLTSAAVLVLFVTFVYSALQSEPRYSIPFRGLEIALAAWGSAWIIGCLRPQTGNPEADHISPR